MSFQKYAAIERSICSKRKISLVSKAIKVAKEVIKRQLLACHQALGKN